MNLPDSVVGHGAGMVKLIPSLPVTIKDIHSFCDSINDLTPEQFEYRFSNIGSKEYHKSMTDLLREYRRYQNDKRELGRNGQGVVIRTDGKLWVTNYELKLYNSVCDLIIEFSNSI